MFAIIVVFIIVSVCVIKFRCQVQKKCLIFIVADDIFSRGHVPSFVPKVSVDINGKSHEIFRHFSKLNIT